MNPVLNLVNGQKQNSQVQVNNTQTFIDELKSGKINPKEQSLEILKKMSPQQKVALRQMLPQIKQLGKVFGASDDQIERFTKELNSSL